MNTVENMGLLQEYLIMDEFLLNLMRVLKYVLLPIA